MVTVQWQRCSIMFLVVDSMRGQLEFAWSLPSNRTTIDFRKFETDTFKKIHEVIEE